ncbi:hypothetical protein [Luteitalea sp.]
MSADVWTDLEARGLLLDLEARGIVLSVHRGNLASQQAGLLTDADRALLAEHKPALLLLVLAFDDRTLVRLARLQAGEVGPPVLLPGLCRDCGDSLPLAVRWGVCGWCAIARRQHTRAPLPESLLEVFPAEVVGLYARRGALEGGAGSRVSQGRSESGGLFAGVA